MAADPNKVLRIHFPAAEIGFDPARVSDLYSNIVTEAIFEPLLTYDFLARPVRLVPHAAAAMPEVTDEGRTYLFRLKKGVQFASDPAFKGARRELVASDFAYTIKRLIDPKIRSPWRFMVEGKIAGLDALEKKAVASGRFDYDAPVEGLEVVDRHTLRIRLTSTDYNFAYLLAMPTLGAVAREVVEKYGDDIHAHPVGTGPYRLKEWVRSSRMLLEANPDYRVVEYASVGADDPWDREAVAAMRGKRIPQIGRVDIRVIEEGQSVFLALTQGQLDYAGIPFDFIPKALPAGQLAPDLAARGLRHFRGVEPDITYTAFNMQDPLVGGLTPEKIALRRAILMAYDVDEEVERIFRGQAIPLHMPIPPEIVGHDPSHRSVVRFDPELANLLLDRFGYRRGADGYRSLPDGRPLLIRFATETSTINRDSDELWKKSMDRIGIRLEFVKSKFAENYKAAKQCQLMFWGQAWTADYPDGENFLQLFYGPNVGQSNNGCYRNPAYDRLFEAARKLPNSPERTLLYRKMARQLDVDSANRLGVARLRNTLIHPQVKGYKKHPILNADFVYLDLEARRP